MFRIRSSAEKNARLLTLESPSGEVKATVLQSAGAALQSYSVRIGGDRFEFVGGSRIFLPHREGYRGVKLFPFPNRIRDGRFSFGGATFQLPLNQAEEGHAIHGLVYSRPFELTSQYAGTDQARVELFYRYRGDLPGFPFPFELSVRYHLDRKGSLQVTTRAENTGRKAMPCGDGWHPYFQFPGKDVNGLRLQIPAQFRFELDERKIPTGKMVEDLRFNSLGGIGGTVLDDCFVVTGEDGWATVRLEDPDSGLKLISRQKTGDRGYNYLQVYTTPERRSIAIEPMTCIPDAFNNGVGLIVLQPGEAVEWHWKIEATA